MDEAVSPWGAEPPGGWADSLGVPHLEIHDTLPSTNDYLRHLATSGCPLFTTIVARSQSEGRGRGGKRWHSAPDGGLWISVLLPIPSGGLESGIGVLPLAVGVAAARAVEAVAGVRVDLKWPNDLLLSGAKFGGILCELVNGGSLAHQSRGGEGIIAGDRSSGAIRSQAVVAGIGIDLRRPAGELPEELAEGVSFLEEAAGTRLHEPQLAVNLLSELRQWTDPAPRWLEGELRAEWEARDALIGRDVQVVEGEERIGVARGVAPGGALLLEGVGGGIEEIWSGTVRAQASAHR